MKKGTLSSSVLALALVAGLIVATSPVAGQSVLIDVNQYDVNAVTFTTTGNFASANDSSQTEDNGVDLTSYFTAGVTDNGGPLSGSLTPAGAGNTAFDTWETDDFFSTGTNLDLNLFSSTSGNTEDFTTSSAAFTGTVTINLSAYLAELPATGTMEPIYSGYGRNPGVVIGYWQVVPEPTSLAQLALGGFTLSGLLAWRTRRASSRR